MKPFDPEAAVSRALDALPAPKAPPTLLPRVLAAARREERKIWYLHPWTSWPRSYQLISAAASVALAWVCGGGWALVADREAPEAVAAARILWHLLIEPNAIYLAALSVSLGAVSIVFCAALSRILREGRP